MALRRPVEPAHARLSRRWARAVALFAHAARRPCICDNPDTELPKIMRAAAPADLTVKGVVMALEGYGDNESQVAVTDARGCAAHHRRPLPGLLRRDRCLRGRTGPVRTFTVTRTPRYEGYDDLHGPTSWPPMSSLSWRQRGVRRHLLVLLQPGGLRRGGGGRRPVRRVVGIVGAARTCRAATPREAAVLSKAADPKSRPLPSCVTLTVTVMPLLWKICHTPLALNAGAVKAVAKRLTLRRRGRLGGKNACPQDDVSAAAGRCARMGSSFW
ncbi:hypothetical protein B0I32_1392 [Nonomuraea fuscirosea]|uniref:Uncharacterized protein n=1 Tax=Nonomuraea fuscirosea TaxID=1291556 RepID=A0A2T0LXR5_9ACTN|nr:hypothetical protein B0I32_1392 [Nonomuraea fuscirosea]